MKEYVVIGGQYDYKYIGQSNTLRGAKWIATHNVELWDNWQGLVKPRIYLASDVRLINNGYFTYPVPKLFSEPIQDFQFKRV